MQDTISAWFCITNSWLKNGGFLFDDFLAIPGLIAIFEVWFVADGLYTGDNQECSLFFFSGSNYLSLTLSHTHTFFLSVILYRFDAPLLFNDFESNIL